ncbi:MAG TPA: hypothetical protein VN805_14045 [Caulobacteraceae bacterium]|nr:hypothetical protein [Caulobacteraceae bacterium]
MSPLAPITIHAEVDMRERPAVLYGAQQLAEALRAASGVDWPIQLTFWGARRLRAAAGNVVVLSLLCEVESDEPFAETAARWRRRTDGLAAEGAIVMLLTVFRAVSGRRTEKGQHLLERIRRLDRMALDLSRDIGVTVVDIDRAFAHIGARALATDYRLAGRVAAEVAGHTFALSLLSLGLDDTIPVQVQERARTHHGSLREIDTLVRRRLAAG